MSIEPGTVLGTRWYDLDQEGCANKVVTDVKSSILSRAIKRQQKPCRICILNGKTKTEAVIDKGEWYYKHGGRPEKVVHKVCALEHSTVPEKVRFRGAQDDQIDVSISKPAKIHELRPAVAKTYVSPSIDERSFSSGYMHCLQKLFLATADQPELLQSLLMKMGLDTQIHSAYAAIAKNSELSVR